jgi:hypothetical protein
MALTIGEKKTSFSCYASKMSSITCAFAGRLETVIITELQSGIDSKIHLGESTVVSSRATLLVCEICMARW